MPAVGRTEKYSFSVWAAIVFRSGDRVRVAMALDSCASTVRHRRSAWVVPW